RRGRLFRRATGTPVPLPRSCRDSQAPPSSRGNANGLGRNESTGRDLPELTLPGSLQLGRQRSRLLLHQAFFGRVVAPDGGGCDFGRERLGLGRSILVGHDAGLVEPSAQVGGVDGPRAAALLGCLLAVALWPRQLEVVGGPNRRDVAV